MADETGVANTSHVSSSSRDIQDLHWQQQQEEEEEELPKHLQDFLTRVPREYLEDPDVKAPVYPRLKEKAAFIKSMAAAEEAAAAAAAMGLEDVVVVGSNLEEDPEGRYRNYLAAKEREQDLAEEQTSETTEGKPKKTEKQQARRAQVRRAQIRHRQRKADYIKQLELDVSQLRDMVANVEAETAEMRKRNSDIRETLSAAGVMLSGQGPMSLPEVRFVPQSASMPSHTPLERQELLDMDLDALDPFGTSTDLFAGTNWDEMSVSLSMNKSLGKPCFSISPGCSTTSDMTTPSGSITPSTSAEGWQGMTLDQELQAINFILALEHICWDHFLLGDFHSHEDHHIDASDGAHGHHLMATAYLMANAPESLYSERNAFDHASLQPSTAFHWTTPSLSLDSFYGLALSLNQDMTEITPVQAWFELAARYPLDMLFADGVLTSLAAELGCQIRCVVFGAVIARPVFEDAVGRILGPSPYAPVEAIDLEQWMYAPPIEGLV